MSIKSILLSILSIVLFVAVVFGIVLLIKTQFLFAIFGLFLFIIPVIVRAKAIDAASGKIDHAIAKFGVPAISVAIGFIAIMAVAFWIQF